MSKSRAEKIMEERGGREGRGKRDDEDEEGGGE